MGKRFILGVVPGSQQLDWTRATLERESVSGTDRKSVPHGADAATDWSARLAPLKAVPGEIHLAVPAEEALLRVVELPTVDGEEIDGMVDIQMDQFSPFSTDLMQISWELLAQSDSRSRVLMAGIRKVLVENIAIAAREHSLGIHRLDTDLTAFYHVLRKHRKIPEQGRHLLLLRLRDQHWMVLVEDACPAFIRHLGSPGEESLEDFWSGSAEEIESALTEVESDYGVQPLAGIQFWHTGDPPVGLGPLSAALGKPVQFERFAGMETLADAVAERGLSGGPRRLNLAPSEWREQILLSAERRRMATLALGLVAVWMVVLGIGWGLLSMRRNSVAKLDARVEQLKPEAEAVMALQEELKFLTAFTNRSESVLECMREYNIHLPDSQELVISDFIYTKDKGFSLKGKGMQNRVYDYTGKLEASGLFKVGDIEYRSGRFTVNCYFPEGEAP